MWRIIGSWLGVVAFGLAGCGDSATSIPQDKLSKMQDEQQKQADSDEKAMLKQVQAESKKKK